MIHQATALMDVGPSVLEGIVERSHLGITLLTPATGRHTRRVLYLNSYVGANTLEEVKRGVVPGHHLWGCLELVRKGYEVALGDPLPDFYLHRNPLPHDLKLFSFVRTWLGRDGIVYCGHNVLYWIPLLRALGAIRCHIVSLLFAREPLHFSGAHSGIIALNPAAAEQAKKLAPNAKVAHLAWGVDLTVFPRLAYRPEWFLSCGITQRDHHTLQAAAARSRRQIRIISPRLPGHLSWPANVSVVTSVKGEKPVPYRELLLDHYANCTASLIILKDDPIQYTGVGTTNLFEAMAMARPVIVTRTGALPTELDVEKAGCGLFVPSTDGAALAEALEFLAADTRSARAMGEKGRLLAESRYNIVRYANDLHEFFASL